MEMAISVYEPHLLTVWVIVEALKNGHLEGARSAFRYLHNSLGIGQWIISDGRTFFFLNQTLSFMAGATPTRGVLGSIWSIGSGLGLSQERDCMVWGCKLAFTKLRNGTNFLGQYRKLFSELTYWKSFTPSSNSSFLRNSPVSDSAWSKVWPDATVKLPMEFFQIDFDSDFMILIQLRSKTIQPDQQYLSSVNAASEVRINFLCKH